MDEKQEEKLVVEQVQALSLTQSAHAETPKRPGTFRKGDPRINRTLGPYPKEKAEGSGEVPIPPLLRDMRRIYRTQASQDRTRSEKQLRKVFENDFMGFLRQLVQLELAFLRAQTKVARARGTEQSRQDEVVEEDEGTQRARELLERTFDQFQSKE
jgi:hypothetical protein